ncbi:MAG TPA: ATP-dependent DNA ligase [Arthrobacter sp.]|nr:ATP-dependent DNA ligase [Arthrobacter sp.]
MAKTDNRQVVTVEGRRIRLTSLDKVLYPETGTTKAEVLYYYGQIGKWLIPHAANRAVTQKRWVNGVGTAGEPGEVFFQKNLEEKSTPDWVPRQSMTHKRSTNCYPLVNDQATLTWLAQMAALELHVPQWKFDDDGGGRGKPDRMVLDLDPGEGTGLAECAEVARLARAILQDMGLEPMPVTSGSKGIHLYTGLKPGHTSEDISAVAHELARALEADHPDLIVSDMKKSLRKGKVLVDWSQNNAAKTTITPYSLRGRLHPMVAAPRTWEELDSDELQNLDYKQVLERMENRDDPLAALSAGRLSNSVKDAEAAVQQGRRRANVPEGEKPEEEKSEAARTYDRLTTYRNMRDPEKTPEPVPDEIARAEAGRTFVIQEHHARRLHWDFRLERDGVLVSWALPKGVPTDVKKNHLAVHTEDHPIEYGSFEGTIPKGEYGGGDVTIWDAGTYELEKWRDDKEVIVTLYGQDDGGLDGPRKYALINTGSGDGSKDNWLIHLMKDQPSTGRDAGLEEADLPGDDPGKQPPDVVPMMAKQGTVEDIGDEDEWAFEMKWDGIRAIATVYKGKLTLTSRNGNDLTVSYPELEELADLMGNNTAVLDGEIVAVNKTGRPDFGLLQTRMQLTKKSDVEREAKKTRVEFMVFDLLYFNGTSLLKESYRDRRQALDVVLSKPSDGSSGGGPSDSDSGGPATDHIHLPPAIEASAADALESSQQLGLEGIMAKKYSSTYSSGRRSGSWIKIKNQLTQEVVIGGWRPGKGSRAKQIGSLLMGIPDGDDLQYVGRVGTGFSEQELDWLTGKLKKLERKTSPFGEVPKPDVSDAHWVTPKLVGEVRYAERTSSGRLRQPAWRGWRPDKEPEEVAPEG